MELKEIWDKKEELMLKELEVKGWIRNHRPQKEFGFIDFSDGTTFKHLQIVYDNSLKDFDSITKFSNGSSIKVKGVLKKSEGNKQEIELKATGITLLGDCPSDYPLQPKRHSMEFFREIAYLRPRANTFQAVFKIRSVASMAIHEYFQSHGYVYVHTPLFTTTDCEGENQMFKVTTLDFNNLPKNKEGKVDFTKDLFGKETFITGTGQLHGEAYAMAFNKIYTFGPTFRTEKSNTKTHANEFWMIEPEMAFMDLNDLMSVEEEMLKSVAVYVLDKCDEEITFLDKFVSNGLKEKLKNLVSSTFTRITHHDAIDLLKNSGQNWEFEPRYESDIAKEHEKYITDYFQAPVFITAWPKDIKAWYMKLNEDGKTVAAVDLLVPGSGELMGGSERENNLDKLMEQIKNHHVDTTEIEWYINLRRYGGCYHSGFGMGFERLIMYLTGIDNIRDVIPFPRTPKSCDF